MAIAHSAKAGQWAKRQARNAHMRTFVIAMLVAFVIIAGCSFLAGFLFGDRTPLVALLALLTSILMAVAAWMAMRWVDKRFDEAAVQRLKYLRGAQAEAYVSMLLRDLPEDWHVFDNVMLDDRSDVDHVVIGPRGLFTVSTKGNRGLFEHGPQGTTMNGEVNNWPQRAVQQALRLRDQLAVVSQGSVPWVQPVLAIPFGFIKAPGMPPQADSAWILHEDALCEELEKSPRQLRKGDVDQLVSAVQALVARRLGSGVGGSTEAASRPS